MSDYFIGKAMLEALTKTGHISDDRKKNSADNINN